MDEYTKTQEFDEALGLAIQEPLDVAKFQSLDLGGAKPGQVCLLSLWMDSINSDTNLNDVWQFGRVFGAWLKTPQGQDGLLRKKDGSAENWLHMMLRHQDRDYLFPVLNALEDGEIARHAAVVENYIQTKEHPQDFFVETCLWKTFNVTGTLALLNTYLSTEEDSDKNYFSALKQITDDFDAGYALVLEQGMDPALLQKKKLPGNDSAKVECSLFAQSLIFEHREVFLDLLNRSCNVDAIHIKDADGQALSLREFAQSQGSIYADRLNEYLAAHNALSSASMARSTLDEILSARAAKVQPH